MSWKEKLAGQAPRADDANDAHDAQPAEPAESAAAPLVVANGVAAELVRDRPLAPQVIARLDRANDRRAALKTEIAALALDAELGDHGAAERQRKLQSALVKAVVEVETLQAALAEAEVRDAAAADEVDIAETEAAFAKYRKFADARLLAMHDLTAAGAAVQDALGRLKASVSLLETALPRRCRLPAGYRVDMKLDTVAAVARENEFIVQHIARQVRTTVAFKRGKEIAA
jgi:hypothetical protein